MDGKNRHRWSLRDLISPAVQAGGALALMAGTMSVVRATQPADTTVNQAIPLFVLLGLSVLNPAIGLWSRNWLVYSGVSVVLNSIAFVGGLLLIEVLSPGGSERMGPGGMVYLGPMLLYPAALGVTGIVRAIAAAGR